MSWMDRQTNIYDFQPAAMLSCDCNYDFKLGPDKCLNEHKLWTG